MAEPTLTRAEFAQSIKAKYPVYAKLSDEEVATKMLATYPQYEAQIKKDTPLGPGGDTINGRDPGVPREAGGLRDMLTHAAYPTTLSDFLGLLIPSELAALRGTKIAKTAGATVGEVAELAAPKQSTINTAVDIAKGTYRGVKNYLTKRAPLISDTIKAIKDEGLQREVVALTKDIDDPANVSKALYAIAKKRSGGGTLATADATRMFNLKKIMDEAAAEMRAADLPESVGTAARKASATGVNFNPATVSTRSGPMTATLADKHGLTALQAPDLARISPNSAWTTAKVPTKEQIGNIRQLLMDPKVDTDPVLRAAAIAEIGKIMNVGSALGLSAK